MKTMKTLSRRIAALLLVVTVGITALAPAASASSIQLPSLPKDQCVVDDAGVLSDSTTSELETLNAQLSSSCDGAQIGVLTVDYTGSATTEDYAAGRSGKLPRADHGGRFRRQEVRCSRPHLRHQCGKHHCTGVRGHPERRDHLL